MYEMFFPVIQELLLLFRKFSSNNTFTNNTSDTSKKKTPKLLICLFIHSVGVCMCERLICEDGLVFAQSGGWHTPEPRTLGTLWSHAPEQLRAPALQIVYLQGHEASSALWFQVPQRAGHRRCWLAQNNKHTACL